MHASETARSAAGVSGRRGVVSAAKQQLLGGEPDRILGCAGQAKRCSSGRCDIAELPSRPALRQRLARKSAILGTLFTFAYDLGGVVRTTANVPHKDETVSTTALLTEEVSKQSVAVRQDALEERLNELVALLSEHDRCCWRVGDLCRILHQRHRLSMASLARRTGYARNRLSELRLTAEAFTPEQRQGRTFQDCLMARRITVGMPQLGLTVVEVVHQIANLPGKRPRQVREHFARLLLKREGLLAGQPDIAGVGQPASVLARRLAGGG